MPELRQLNTLAICTRPTDGMECYSNKIFLLGIYLSPFFRLPLGVPHPLSPPSPSPMTHHGIISPSSPLSSLPFSLNPSLALPQPFSPPSLGLFPSSPLSFIPFLPHHLFRSSPHSFIPFLPHPLSLHHLSLSPPLSR